MKVYEQRVQVTDQRLTNPPSPPLHQSFQYMKGGGPAKNGFPGEYDQISNGGTAGESYYMCVRFLLACRSALS